MAWYRAINDGGDSVKGLSDINGIKPRSRLHRAIDESDHRPPVRGGRSTYLIQLIGGEVNVRYGNSMEARCRRSR
ncbi:hypothetical protein D3C81_1179810 [compost metagenome]